MAVGDRSSLAVWPTVLAAAVLPRTNSPVADWASRMAFGAVVPIPTLPAL